jgi:predicted porin
MKKTQMALAAVALVASSAALANDTTIYGSLDVSAAKQTNGNVAFDGSGNWNGSVFGFKGGEDLGSGLKATWQLELGLNVGTGAQDNGGTTSTGRGTNSAGTSIDGYGTSSNFFNRLSNVGLSSEQLGSVKLGQQLSPFIAAALNGVANNNESFYVPLLILAGNRTAEMFGAGGSGYSGHNVSTGGFFIPNAVSYTTPSISGFNATVLKQLDAGPLGAGVAANKFYSYNVTGAVGDLNVAYGYQNRTDDYTGQTITAAYNLGSATVAAGAHVYAPFGGTKVNSYNIGGSYAATDALKVSLQYAANNASTSSSIVNLGGQYSLSKRTHAYVTLSQSTGGAAVTYSGRGAGLSATSGGFSTTTNATGYAVGVYHTF